MKKLISTLLFAAILCVMAASVAAADGMIIWSDDFSTVAENDWIWEGDLFEVRGGGSGYVDRPAAIPPAAGAQQRRSKQTKDSFHTHKTEAVRKSYIPYRETMCR